MILEKSSPIDYFIALEILMRNSEWLEPYVAVVEK